MTLLGALALDEGCQILPLFRNVCSKRKEQGRQAPRREWCDLGVCLQWAGVHYLI